MVSANFTVNGNVNPRTDGEAHAAAYGATVNLALLSITGADQIEWRVVSSSKSGTVLPTVTPGGTPTGATASFVMPANPGDNQGRAFLVECRVRGAAGSAYARAVIGAANASSIIPVTLGEENVRDATYGYTDVLNRGLAGLTPGSPGNQDLASVLAIGANANAVEITNAGAATADTSLPQYGQVKVLIAGAVISPAAIGASQTAYNPAGLNLANIIRVSASGPGFAIHSIEPPTTGPLQKWIVNVGSIAIALTHQHGASTASKQIVVSTGADHSLTGNQILAIYYDTVTQRWRLTPPGAGGGSVDFNSVKAALATADTYVDMNNQGFFDVAGVTLTSAGAIAYGAEAVLGQIAGGTYLRSPTGGATTIRKADYSEVLNVNADTGAVTWFGNRLQNVGDPVAGGDAVNLTTLNTRISASAIQTILATVSGPTTFNNQNLSGINDLTATRLMIAGGSVVAEFAGGMIFGHSGTNATFRASTLWQCQVGGGSPQLAVRPGYVGVSVPFSFESGVAAASAVVGQVGPSTNIDGHEVTYTGQIAGPGNNEGGQGRLTNGATTGTGLKLGGAVGMRTSAGGFEPTFESGEVAAGKVLTALGPHTAIGTQTDPGTNVFQLPAGTFGADNPPAGQVYLIWNATTHRLQVKESSGTVYTGTFTP